jgi:succinoglycan biosynthesis transport protein ExoP
MEILYYFRVLRKWWWLIVAATLVSTVSSYFAVSRMPRVYQATSTVRIGQALDVPNPTYEDFSISQQLARTYSDMVTRQPILVAAADALGLPFSPGPQDVTASIVPGTQLLEISVRDTDPERARALADEIARQLILQTPNEIEKDNARQTFVQTQLANLEKNIQTTEDEIAAAQTQLAGADSARAIQEYEGNISALQQKLASYQATYASLLQSVEKRTNYISVFEAATTPGYPISPRVMQTVLMAAAIGLILAIGGAILIEFIDDTVKTPEDVQKAMNLTPLGAIGEIAGATREERLITAQELPSPIIEAYRVLRTNLQVSSVDEPLRTLLVTSASPYEGKSTTVANLGAIMAQAGHSVVLVDADLRRSSLHRYFGVSNKKGLTDSLLMDEPAPDGWLQETGIENLRVLTSGPLPPNPSELLGSKKMHSLIERLAQDTDIVIFDTPPVLPVTDAMVLAANVDGVLLVAEAGKTRRTAARQAAESLQKVRARILGVVLNRLSARDSNGYGYYEYGPYRGHNPAWRKWIPTIGKEEGKRAVDAES